jgi:polar amino acid transport system ATP-binding protein
MEYSAEKMILYVDGLDVGYKDKNGNVKLVLKDIHLEEFDIVRPNVAATGQTIAFIARSGCGKSTLFKALTGLLKPERGQILMADLSTSDTLSDARNVTEGDIGFVDQKYTLFRHKTVNQICEYALRKSLFTKQEKVLLIDQYLSEWGLTEHRDKYSCELSGGQRQRTAIIEQMLTSKHFMILDEPFSGLDVGNIEKVKTSFTKILSENEYNTIIFSTHDIHLAVELADSIYILGHPEGVTDYSTVIKHFDMKALGLAWKPYSDSHRVVADEIREILLNS